jgi:transposase
MGEPKHHVSDIPKTRLAAQKKTLRSSQATSERVQRLRAEYWAQVTKIDLNDLVFLDEMGVLLGLMRTHARAAPGDRAYDFKPFYRGSKVSVIGAISVSKVLAVMTIDDSMDAAAFKVYVEQCLVPQLWKGAVVMMDNLPAHKAEAIAPLIEAVGARVLYMSPYSPEFNPIEHWWSQLKAFLRQFSPTISKMVDTLIKTAIDLMDPKHLRNWFAHCCYCPS